MTTIAEVYDQFTNVLRRLDHEITDADRVSWLVAVVRVWDSGQEFRNERWICSVIEARLKLPDAHWQDYLLGKIETLALINMSNGLYDYEGIQWAWRVPSGTHFDKDTQVWEVLISEVNNGANFSVGVQNLPGKDLMTICKSHADDCAWVFHYLYDAYLYAERYGGKIRQMDMSDCLLLAENNEQGFLYYGEGIHC